MLMLLFYVGDDRYACECDHIIEIIPKVALKPVTHTQDYVGGVLNYAGAPVPVVDFSMLCHGRSSSPFLSTRIIILRRETEDSVVQTMGLMAERVTDTIGHELADFSDSGVHLRDAPYLGGVVHDDQGIIHSVVIDKLFDTVDQVLR